MPNIINCPICTSNYIKRIIVIRSSQICKCSSCGHCFLRSSKPQDLTAIYQSEGYAGFRQDPVFQKTVNAELTQNFITRVPPPASLLDVGCGNGDFLFAAQQAGYRVEGIDISAGSISICQSRGLTAVKEEFTNFHKEEKFDLITMWDLIEHLPDPSSFVHHAYCLLKPDGYLMIKTPHVTTTLLKIVQIFPRAAGSFLQTPNHIQFFSHNSLLLVLQNNGFNKLEWLGNRPMRSMPPAGDFRRLVVRTMKKLLTNFGMTKNHYIMARKSTS